MNIRQAILAAANSIEASPREFNFRSCSIPNDGCGTPGCALGWISAHLGLRTRHIADPDGVLEFLGKEYGVNSISTDILFYSRMNLLNASWKWNHRDCAQALRGYADLYHPESRAMIPDSVRRIFTMTREEISREFA